MSYITENDKIFRIVLSKPEKNLDKLMETAGKNLLACISENPAAANGTEKLKISPEDSENSLFFAELYTKTQVFHRHLKKSEICGVLECLVSSVFKNAEIENETITVLTGKKGNVSVLKKSRLKSPVQTICRPSSLSREKNYIIKEGKPVRFLVELGIMTKDGKVHSRKYGKFRQINRFLEFAADLLPETDTEKDAEDGRQKTFSIIDFGCGKSYLTFALYYYLSEIKKIPVEITGIDLKKDVIRFCSSLAEKCGYNGLKFFCGDIEDWYRNKNLASSGAPSSVSPDLVVTLHACDTATDYALAFAVKHCAKAILSVPCCQHELNQGTSRKIPDMGLSAMFKYGIIKERFCALATDTLRAELLSGCGYSTQLLEFTDADDTPKNLLIRAVRADSAEKGTYTLTEGFSNLKASVGKSITLEKLLFEN